MHELQCGDLHDNYWSDKLHKLRRWNILDYDRRFFLVHMFKLWLWSILRYRSCRMHQLFCRNVRVVLWSINVQQLLCWDLLRCRSK